MKYTQSLFLLITLVVSVSLAQRDYETHQRGMLRQTIYNTGETGRALDANSPKIELFPADVSLMEWPPNGRGILDGTNYFGHQNSFGSGILFRAKINGTYVEKACGGITDGSGNSTLIIGLYSIPTGYIQKVENFPLLANGSLNPAYNPNEAEEIITTTYRTTEPMQLLITQTSRAWSFPGYDAFIIIEYDIMNTDTTDYYDGFVMFENAIAPSAFGMQRKYGGLWSESSTTTRAREVYARYNLTRYLSYVHARDGWPDQVYFDKWSGTNDRGGLDGPQAVGVMILHYDYDHLQPRDITTYTLSDTARAWDANGKFRQPYTTQQIPNRNVDLSSSRAISYGLTLTSRSYQGWDFKQTGSTARTDSINFANLFAPYKSCSWNPALADPAANQAIMDYWHGRSRPRAYGTNGYTQTTLHYNSFGPYIFKKGEHLKFAIAQLVGYGAGSRADTVWRDPGGFSTEAANFFRPVPSWYDSLTYPGLSSVAGLANAGVGSAYLQTHPLPWYVTGKISQADTTPVISLRDVADRAIQMYSGQTLKKYDGIQLKPDSTSPTGVYNSTNIPIPAPVMSVDDAVDFKNKIVWGPQVEDFLNLTAIQGAKAAGRIKAGISHYLVLKSPEGLGPWNRLDSVGIRDSRYYGVDPKYPGMYVLRDTMSLLSENYYYCVISVDSVGGKSGMTNMTYHETQKGAVEVLGKVYVVPNPFIVTSTFGGSTKMGDIKDRIGFYGLPKRATIRIFSYSGQLVSTIEHEKSVYSHEYFQISRNNQMLASGVYFYVVEDLDAGTRATGKFVIIH